MELKNVNNIYDARTRPWYPKIQLKIRFKNQFCYIDTVSEGDGRVFPLCRLRNLLRGWSMALFTYSNERYEPCRYPSGEWEGTIHVPDTFSPFHSWL